MLIHVFLTNRHRTQWEEKNLAPNEERGGDPLFTSFERNGERGGEKKGERKEGEKKEKDNSQSGHSFMKEIVD